MVDMKHSNSLLPVLILAKKIFPKCELLFCSSPNVHLWRVHELRSIGPFGITKVPSIVLLLLLWVFPAQLYIGDCSSLQILELSLSVLVAAIPHCTELDVPGMRTKTLPLGSVPITNTYPSTSGQCSPPVLPLSLSEVVQHHWQIPQP